MATETDALVERAVELLELSPLIDGHNDLAFALRMRVGGIGVSKVDLRQPVEGIDTDIPRLRAGRVGGQFWTCSVGRRRPTRSTRSSRGAALPRCSGSRVAR